MRAVDGDGRFCGAVPLGTKVRDVVKLVAQSELPVQVVDATGGRSAASTVSTCLSLIAGERAT